MPFAALAGSWSGNGTITTSDGTKERLHCDVQYLVTANGNNLQQTLRCASDSYQFHVNAYVASAGGVLTGNWTETTRNVSGRIAGQATNGRIEVDVAEGGAFSAKMVMLTRGNRQSVTIEPKGTDIKLVSVTLNKTQ